MAGSESEEEMVKVSLRIIVPVIPDDAEERALLVEDLSQVGCAGLIERPWNFKDEPMVWKVLSLPSNEWKKTLRANPNKWLAGTWREVYGFPKVGEGLDSRMDKFTLGKFRTAPHAKNGYIVSECKNEREKRVLEFVVPILSLDRTW